MLTRAQNSCLPRQFHRIHEVQVNVTSECVLQASVEIRTTHLAGKVKLQEKEYLELLIYTMGKPMFHVLNKKKAEIVKEISRMLKCSSEPLPARRITRVTGLCIFLLKAVGSTHLSFLLS